MARSPHKPKSKIAASVKSKAKAAMPRRRVGSDGHGTLGVDMARLEVTWPRLKQPVNLRIDSDIIDWFRSGGAGYQTRMNAVLRAFVDAQSKRR